MTENTENCPTCPSTDPEPAPVTPKLDPNRPGLNKANVQDPIIHPPPVPKPAGVTFEISKVWIHGLTGSPQNSLTDQSVDEPLIFIRKEELEQFGAGGLDMINFEVKANLEGLKEKANIAWLFHWDPGRWPEDTTVIKGQNNLPEGSHPVWRHRAAYLPKKPFMRAPGDHELLIAVQIRTDAQTGSIMTTGDRVGWTEFPHVGDIVIRTIKFVIQA